MTALWRNSMPPSATSTLVADSQAWDPFSQAINQFLLELRDGADDKNPFVKEIKAARQRQTKDDDGKDQSKVAAADLKNFVQDLEAQKQAHPRRRMFKRVTPFIDNLSKLMGMCETLLQAAPFGVNVAFAGARVVLGLAVQVGNCFDTIVDGIEEIGISLRYYEKFAEAFRDSPDLQELLVSSYKRVIRFWFNISRILSTGILKGAMKSLVAPIDKEVNVALKGLRHDGDRVSISAQATMAQQTERDREIRRREGIIKWMTSDSSVDVRVDLRDQVELHQRGTCQWLLDDQRFKHWCQSQENAVLWYHAHPASGKTVLAAAVIEHLKAQGQNVAYFFYSFNNPSRKQGISGLRYLALQLFHLAKFVPQTLQDRFDKEMEFNTGGLHDQSTAVATVHDLLKHACANICIVVDGLDECSDEAPTLMSFKNLLGLDTYGVVKWFFTSRDHPQIRATMQKGQALEIKAETDLISQDIQAYLSEYVTCQKCVTKWSKGEDNFLYARLICEALRGEGLTSEEEIDLALSTYPKDLNGYYMRVLEKLSERSESEQERARRTFLFMVAAAQSVSLNELLDFLAITKGAKDFDQRRIPFIEAIRNLCSPFIVFDKPGQGDAVDNPLLKLCHKTVEDFFRQNSDDLEVTSTKLQRYFVKGEEADRNIGLDCLIYLQYERYQKPDVVHNLDAILRKPVPREHAFLAYAATFWAQHLERVSPTPEVYQAVREFLRSPAFWTCLGVQTRIGRYLFGRYIGCKSSSQYQMGIRGSRTRGDDSFGLPLPRWLDRYSHEGLMLDRSMCYFVDEWREVLMTCSDGLQSCLPLRAHEPSCHLHPLEKPRQCRIAHLSQHLSDARLVGGCRLLGVDFVGKTPWADVLLRDRNRPNRIQYLRVPLFLPKKNMESRKKMTWKEVHDLPIAEGYDDWIVSITRPVDGNEALEALKVDSETLNVHCVSLSSSVVHEVLPVISTGPMGSRRGKWETRFAQDVVGATGRLRIVHLAWRLQEISAGQERLRLSRVSGNNDSDGDTDTSEEEEDDASSDYSSSDDDSETDSSGSPQSTAESSNGTWTTDLASGASGKFTTDCLLVAASGGKPHWIPWSTSQRIWSRVGVATHPTLPLLVVTHTERQLELVDVVQGTRTTRYLPEPREAAEGTPVASVRELGFSPCGNYLHFLRMSFYPQRASTEVCISASTFRFKGDSDGEDALIRHSEGRGYQYTFGETLADVGLPLSLTCWSETEVVIALPPLTCDPRIIKIGWTAAKMDASWSFCTLGAPIYLPTSTCRRKAQLLYRRAQGKNSDYLFLTLDSLPLALDGVEQAPVVLRWKLAELGGWRVWDDERDGTASDVKRGISAWQLLKGDFVDNDKYFSVPIRSGLDWTRKAYLSCAAF